MGSGAGLWVPEVLGIMKNCPHDVAAKTPFEPNQHTSWTVGRLAGSCLNIVKILLTFCGC